MFVPAKSSALAALVLAAVCLFGLAPQESVVAQQGTSIELVPQVPTVVTIGAPGKTNLHFRVGDKQYFTLQVREPQAELSMALIGPDRQVKRFAICARNIRMSEIATAAGEYRIELSSCDRELVTESQVVLSALTQPAEKERLRVAA